MTLFLEALVALGCLLILGIVYFAWQTNSMLSHPKWRIPLFFFALFLFGVYFYYNHVEKQEKFEPDVVLIKAGCFMMGSPDSEIGRDNRDTKERQHSVCIVKDFAIGKYEVTQAQWQAVMGSNPSYIKGDNLPVENVSYLNVQDFISKLNARTGKNYRLPTEAEWEYAARAGTTTPFYTGECISTEQANFNDNYEYGNCRTAGKIKETTVAVGSYPANPWGLYDMAGNVVELTCSASGYFDNYAGAESVCATDTTTRRAIRGGGYVFSPSVLRSASRSHQPPDLPSSVIGFRLVRIYRSNAPRWNAFEDAPASSFDG